MGLSGRFGIAVGFAGLTAGLFCSSSHFLGSFVQYSLTSMPGDNSLAAHAMHSMVLFQQHLTAPAPSPDLVGLGVSMMSGLLGMGLSGRFGIAVGFTGLTAGLFL